MRTLAVLLLFLAGCDAAVVDDSITGRYDLAMTSEGRVVVHGTIDLEFGAEPGSLVGRHELVIRNTSGPGPVAGTFGDGQVRLTFRGWNDDYRLHGLVEDGEIRGTWRLGSLGPPEGAFVARRP